MHGQESEGSGVENVRDRPGGQPILVPIALFASLGRLEPWHKNLF